MSAGVSVAATGSALSFLLFENGNSRNNQAGFLLGDVQSEKKNLISDADYGEEKTETVIHVHAVLQNESLSSSYTVKDDNYHKSGALGKNRNSIVGWYSFRRNVAAVPTLKERLIHKQLLEKLHGNAERFLFCLLTSSENSDTKSHNFRQHFLLYNPICSKFEAVPLLIENLANISPQYRSPLPPTGELLLQKHIDPTWKPECFVDKLQEKLAFELQGAVKELVDSEQMVHEAEQRLLKLRKERDELKQLHETHWPQPSKGDESNVCGESEREVKRDNGGCGDTKLNRYQTHLRPHSGLRGVLSLPPTSNLSAEARPFNPRFYNPPGGIRSYYS